MQLVVTLVVQNVKMDITTKMLIANVLLVEQDVLNALKELLRVLPPVSHTVSKNLQDTTSQQQPEQSPNVLITVKPVLPLIPVEPV